jgi:hypothetical protein
MKPTKTDWDCLVNWCGHKNPTDLDILLWEELKRKVGR